MTRLPPVSLNDLSEADRDLLVRAVDIMGFSPNDAHMMARVPGLVQASFGLVQAVLVQGQLPAGLKRMIGLAASVSAGCEYCQSHARFSADRLDVPLDKVKAIMSGEYGSLNAAEAAAVTVAARAGKAPSKVSDANFDTLKLYYSDDECAEIVAVIALYGFLNRWNATLKTEIEAEAAAACQLF